MSDNTYDNERQIFELNPEIYKPKVIMPITKIVQAYDSSMKGFDTIRCACMDDEAKYLFVVLVNGERKRIAKLRVITHSVMAISDDIEAGEALGIAYSTYRKYLIITHGKQVPSKRRGVELRVTVIKSSLKEKEKVVRLKGRSVPKKMVDCNFEGLGAITFCPETRLFMARLCNDLGGGIVAFDAHLNYRRTYRALKLYDLPVKCMGSYESTVAVLEGGKIMSNTNSRSHIYNLIVLYDVLKTDRFKCMATRPYGFKVMKVRCTNIISMMWANDDLYIVSGDRNKLYIVPREQWEIIEKLPPLQINGTELLEAIEDKVRVYRYATHPTECLRYEIYKDIEDMVREYVVKKGKEIYD